jgi:hypothetical protein
MTCERCGIETRVHTCSMFNTDTICMDCAAAEKKLPEYEAARAAEEAAVRAGNYNYAGVGLPARFHRAGKV